MSIHPTPHTDNALDTVRRAVDAVPTAVQADMAAVVAQARAEIDAAYGAALRSSDPEAARRVMRAGTAAEQATTRDELEAAIRLLYPAPAPTAPRAAAAPTQVLPPPTMPPATPAPQRRQRFTPAPAGEDEEAPAWFAGFAGNFQQWTEGVDDTLDNHEERITALEANGGGSTAGPNWRIGGIAAAVVFAIMLLLGLMVWHNTFVMALGWALFAGLGIGTIVAYLTTYVNSGQHR